MTTEEQLPLTAEEKAPLPHGMVEEVFETVLFNSRFLVLVAVIGVLTSSAVMFVKGCIEVIQGVTSFIPDFRSIQPNSKDDSSVILSFIPAIDNYLFATILLIISMGLYELFISEIDPKSRKKSTRPNWIIIKDLDDLKSKIGEVVVMILIVNFFKLSFGIDYTRPIDLLALAGGILLVAAALVVTHYVSGLKKLLSRKA
ncbi:MAG TPA: YqhA family protein [Blastocatellia bacterium]|nr:YqhA family protein [Blastocatellia bacterium]